MLIPKRSSAVLGQLPWKPGEKSVNADVLKTHTCGGPGPSASSKSTVGENANVWTRRPVVIPEPLHLPPGRDGEPECGRCCGVRKSRTSRLRKTSAPANYKGCHIALPEEGATLGPARFCRTDSHTCPAGLSAVRHPHLNSPTPGFVLCTVKLCSRRRPPFVRLPRPAFPRT